MKADPNAIAPERTLVIETDAQISTLAIALRNCGFTVLFDEEIDQHPDAGNTEAQGRSAYFSIGDEAALKQLQSAWRRFDANEPAPHGKKGLWAAFDQMTKLRAWGPKDRLSAGAESELRARIDADRGADQFLQIEIWPTAPKRRRDAWREEIASRVSDSGGSIVDRCVDLEFGYDGLLVRLPGTAALSLIDDPAAPSSLATLDGVQFLLPQSVASADTPVPESELGGSMEPFPDTLSIGALLFDSAVVDKHEALAGGVEQVDALGLEARTAVGDRQHGTAMASLIVRGDLDADGAPAPARLLSIPLLSEAVFAGRKSCSARQDALFVAQVDKALRAAFLGDAPLAPSAFCVNLSVGVREDRYAGRISGLARLLDWWAAEHGVLFVVAAGNATEPLATSLDSFTKADDATMSEKSTVVLEAIEREKAMRTLLSPAEAMNALTVGAADLDLSQSESPLARDRFFLEGENPAPSGISSFGPGARNSIKPDVMVAGGRQPWTFTMGSDPRAKVVDFDNTCGLTVASPPRDATQPNRNRTRSRGTSSATALATRLALQVDAALVAEGGPFAGERLTRTDRALMTRALIVHAASWGEYGVAERERRRIRLLETRKTSQAAILAAKMDVARKVGFGLADTDRATASPSMGASLVGFGDVERDEGAIFSVPLPNSISGMQSSRSMRVTLSWFSPVSPRAATYRSVKLVARPVDEDGESADEVKWSWEMKGGDSPDTNSIARGSVWSHRLVNRLKGAPVYDEEKLLRVKVERNDPLDTFEEPLRFAIAVTLEAEVTTGAAIDIFEEIRDRVRVFARSG